MSLTFRRPLVQALIVSLLLHFVLLISVAVLVPEKPGLTAAALKVVMSVETRRPVTAPVKTPPRAAAPPVVERANVAPAKPSIPARRKPEEQTIMAVAPTPASDAPAVAAPPASPAASVAVSSAAASVETSNGSVAKAAPGPVADAPVAINKNDVADLRASLGSAARRFKRYPRLARERGWEGTVEIVLVYHTHPPSPEIRVGRSSGRSMLDEQAMEMLSRAAETTALPAGLKGRDFQLTLPVVFSLEDDQ